VLSLASMVQCRGPFCADRHSAGLFLAQQDPSQISSPASHDLMAGRKQAHSPSSQGSELSTEAEAQESDFVIVGAGSAGCVLAARLSENQKYNVTLLEAGGHDTNRWIHIPLGFGKTFADLSVNWGYETEADPGIAGRKIWWPRGKVLGGSSSINGLLYIRGQKEDFDLWRQLGNTGWSFQDVLPYFKRAEDRIGAVDEFHGVGGPIAVSDTVEPDPMSDAFIQSAVALGFPHNPDFNGSDQEGAGYHQTTIRRGRRCSTAVGYLRPAMRRPNLRVITHAASERILFEDRRAVGVVYTLPDGMKRTVRARREVIVSAGAINSPQLLMLSGVGPAAHLAEHGINVVQDLKGVGQNLQDHYTTPIKLKCTQPVTVNDIMLSTLRKLRAGIQYYGFRRGALARAVSAAALFARTRPEVASPDVKLSVSPFSADRPQDGLHPWSGFTLGSYQLRPESRGEIRLKSVRPDVPPLMIPNYLSATLDQETAVAGLKLCRTILAHPLMQSLVSSEYLPGPNVRSDDELLDYSRRYGSTSFHPTCTCKMGIDAMAVVDPQLRVHGTQALRVVDASIMPTVASGNTNAPTIMIGEKASDLIRTEASLT
jgi:choline dehydrogenase